MGEGSEGASCYVSGCVSASDCGYGYDCRVCHWRLPGLCYVSESESVKRLEVLLSAHVIWTAHRRV
jgi:hypothetical protein